MCQSSVSKFVHPSYFYIGQSVWCCKILDWEWIQEAILQNKMAHLSRRHDRLAFFWGALNKISFCIDCSVCEDVRDDIWGFREDRKEAEQGAGSSPSWESTEEAQCSEAGKEIPVQQQLKTHSLQNVGGSCQSCEYVFASSICADFLVSASGNYVWGGSKQHKQSIYKIISFCLRGWLYSSSFLF